MYDETARAEQRTRIQEGLSAARAAAENEIKAMNAPLMTTKPGVRVVGVRPPPPIHLFHGRTNELRLLAEHLKDPGVRVVVIIGTSGMGKTALARKLLDELEKAESQAVLSDLFGIVYLSAHTAGISFERLYFDCAQLLGGDRGDELREVWSNHDLDQRAKADRLLQKLEDGNTIILVDNIETELDDRGQFRDDGLKQFFAALHDREAAGRARVLITSQTDVPSPGEKFELKQGVSEDEALTLLLKFDRKGSLGLDKAPDHQLRQLADKARGIPRALQLAVSLMIHGKRIEEVIEVLDSADRERIVETLSAANYQLLRSHDPDACRVLEALAIYGRLVPLVAIDWLLELTLPGADVPAIVERLSASHTITRETYGELRSLIAVISLHPTDHRAILFHLGKEQARRCHIRAAEFYANIRLTKPWSQVRQLDPQLLEIKHCMKANEFHRALEVLDTIDYSWHNHHKYLAHMMSLGMGASSIELRTQLLPALGTGSRAVHNQTALGWVCRRMGQKKTAEHHLREAKQNALRTDDEVAQIFSLSELGYFLTDNAANHDEAEENLALALNVACNKPNRYGEAHALLGLAFVEFQRQRNELSRQYATQALDIFQTLADPAARHREIDCLIRLGMIHRKMGADALALEATTKGLEAANRYGIKDWEAEAYSGLGFHHRGAGRYKEARQMHEQALKLFQAQHRRREQAVQHSYLGNLQADTGEFEGALKCYAQAEDIVQAIGLQRELSWIRANRGIVHCREGKYGRAATVQQAALNLVVEHGQLDSQVIRHTDLAATFLAWKDYAAAKNALQSALACSSRDQGLNLPPSLPDAYLQCPMLEDKLPQEMLSPFDHERRGALLARIYLQEDQLETALSIIDAASRRPIEHIYKPSLAALRGVILGRLRRSDEAVAAFQEAARGAEAATRRTRDFYEAWYAKGLAQSGLAILSPPESRAEHRSQSVTAYRQATRICRAVGVVEQAKSLFAELGMLPDGALPDDFQTIFPF